MPVYSLRFISGKYQGGEFPLHMEREIVIGRSSDLDMVLIEDMISRKHAKISTVGGVITIQDLGSTNGTFVNGEKIDKVVLTAGDRILVGSSIMRLVALDESKGSGVLDSEADARKRLDTAGQRAGQSRPMSGVIDEIPLPDLLQLLSTSRKSGVLAISSPRGLGKIYFRKGAIYYATINDDLAISPGKAINRLFSWIEGAFELMPADDRQFHEELNSPTEFLLMEGMRQLDELKRLELEGNVLPSPEVRLAPAAPLPVRLRDLAPEELDGFQLVLDHRSVQTILDRHLGSDLDAYVQILSLMRQKLIVVSR